MAPPMSNPPPINPPTRPPIRPELDDFDEEELLFPYEGNELLGRHFDVGHTPQVTIVPNVHTSSDEQLGEQFALQLDGLQPTIFFS